MTITTHAQDDKPITLHIGDHAPPLRAKTWLKGQPVKQFKKGKVYVLEFWATWCAPCRAAMPHLSALAEKYRNKATVIGIDVYEIENTSPKKIKAFVDSMGKRMDYYVAVEDSNFMATGWLMASGEQGIPRTMVVNTAGKLAWIGHPMYLGKVLPQIVDNTWDIEKAMIQRNTDKYLDSLDTEAHYDLLRFRGDYRKDSISVPDSALLAIDDIVKKEPRLKYAPSIAYETFSSLLQTNMQMAYEYAKVAMVIPPYKEPTSGFIIDVIDTYSNKLNLSPEIYRLGAEAYQVYIDWVPYPEILKLYKDYSKMADWYARANNKTKAIEAQEKAIEILKNKKNFSNSDLISLESKLMQYMDL